MISTEFYEPNAKSVGTCFIAIERKMGDEEPLRRIEAFVQTKMKELKGLASGVIGPNFSNRDVADGSEVVFYKIFLGGWGIAGKDLYGVFQEAQNTFHKS